MREANLQKRFTDWIIELLNNRGANLSHDWSDSFPQEKEWIWVITKMIYLLEEGKCTNTTGLLPVCWCRSQSVTVFVCELKCRINTQHTVHAETRMMSSKWSKVERAMLDMSHNQWFPSWLCNRKGGATSLFSGSWRTTRCRRWWWRHFRMVYSEDVN